MSSFDPTASQMLSSVREAVEQLDPATREHLAMRRALETLARDPASRLCGIRDVTLWMLPDYLPDPRRSIEDLRREIAADVASRDEFLARYTMQSDASDRVWNIAKLHRDYPSWPKTEFLHLKWYKGHLIVKTYSSSGTVYTPDRKILAFGTKLTYFGFGVMEIDGRIKSIPGCGHGIWADISDAILLPCGVYITEWSDEYRVVNDEDRVIWAKFNGRCHRFRIIDDYGEELISNETCSGVTRLFMSVTVE